MSKANAQLQIDDIRFVTGLPRVGHTRAALARTPSLFRFASVAGGPRFSHDAVNLTPDCDG
jgi:hypothetical protein